MQDRTGTTVSGFTPGPWKLTPTSIDDEAFTLDVVAPQSPPHIESVGSCPTVATLWYRTSEAEAKANGRLIAKAPDMAEALAEIVEALEAYCDDHNTDRPTDPTVLLPMLRAALEG